MKYIDWLVFNNVLAADNQMTSFDYFFPGDAFYSVVGSKIKVDTSLRRSATIAILSLPWLHPR